MENNELKQRSLVKGLRLLRTSNILSIVATIVAIVGSLVGVIALMIGMGSTLNGNTTLTPDALPAVGVGLVGLLVAIGGAIVTLVAGIMGIVALIKAGGSHSGYRTALLFIGLGIVLTAATLFMSNLQLLSQIITVVCVALNFMVVYFVIDATAALLRDKGNLALAEKGLAVRKMYMICAVVILAFQILLICPFLAKFIALASVISMVASIVQMVALFKYIGFLGQSATALEG